MQEKDIKDAQSSKTREQKSQERKYKSTVKEASYLKKSPQSRMTLKEELKTFGTNFLYKLGGVKNFQLPGILKFSSSKQIPSEENFATVLGSKLHKQQAQQSLRNIIWFTYRKHMDFSETMHSDVGWGCLPRVGQMALAQALKTLFSLIKAQGTTKSIIAAFLDQGVQQRYSITKIIALAEKQFGYKAGAWFNMVQICQVLKELQNTECMRGSESLKVFTAGQGYIFLKGIYRKMGIEPCACQKPRAKCNKCHGHLLNRKSKIYQPNHIDGRNGKAQGQINGNRWKPIQNNVLLLVIVRASANKVTQESYKAMLQLMNLGIFQGIIGGVPKKAVYIVGHQNDSLLFLDPHYVQEEVSRQNFNKNFSTFFCDKYRTLRREEIDPCMAFSFYLQNINDIAILVDAIDNMREKYEHECFMSYTWDEQEVEQPENLNSSQSSSPIEDSLSCFDQP